MSIHAAHTRRARIALAWTVLFFAASSCLSPAALAGKPIDWDKKLAKERQLMKTNNVEQAIEILSDLEHKHPESGPVHTDMGRCLKLRGKLAEAKAEFRRSSEVDPNYADAWYELGAMQQSDKEWQLAVDTFEHYLQIAPFSERKDAVKDRINFCKSQM